MNRTFKVFDKGRIYVEGGIIRAIRESDGPAPAGFEKAPRITTRGTIYPGLIELHNHLSYNPLQMWQVPRIFAHRGQWSGHPDKRRLISQPMSVLASIGGTIEAIVRYVEAKCLVGGVTASQGLTLMAAPGIEHKYRGIVRNVENTDDPTLPEALTRIADVTDAKAFAKRLASAQKNNAALLLHLAEGIGEQARRHFLNLKIQGDRWAITPSLVGIHGAGLLPQDLAVFGEHGGSLVWSPLSNLLLYGGTADVEAAKRSNVMLALGSDWSPSGSKNLLSELKVARAWSGLRGGVFSSRELVAMATINPARMVRWDAALGSIEPDKRADLLIVKGAAGDAYDKLLEAQESDIDLVFINGVPRFGRDSSMKRALAKLLPADLSRLESRKVGTEQMKFNFVQETADPLVAAVSLELAEQRLREGLRDLPELASALTDPLTATSMLGVEGAIAKDSTAHRWVLALDNEPHAETALEGSARPLAPASLRPDEFRFGADALALNASNAANLVSLKLDALTVVEDSTYFERLAAQINLPNGFARTIAKLHGYSLPSEPPGWAPHSPPVSDSPVQVELSLPRSLQELRELRDDMSREDRLKLVRQLYVVLAEMYVHMPLKRAAHAVDPLQRLKLLQYSLEEGIDGDEIKGILFHQRMLEIFNELRDLHTNYILPPPYNDLTAFLPFLLERCFEVEADNPRAIYLVTKVASILEHPTFVPGVELLYWNGMPMENAIHQNAHRQAGSNLAARFARGLAGMTVRPLARVLPPEEEWVLLTYRALDGRTLEIRLPWQISSRAGSSQFEVPALSAQNIRSMLGAQGQRARSRAARSLALLAAFGVDGQMEAVNSARRALYAQSRSLKTTKGAEQDIQTKLPNVLRARVVRVKRSTFGYLRIYTFSVDNADTFVQEVVRLLAKMPKRGLIIDVRNNGGGLIWAAEQLLQLFTDRPVEPERAQFINSPRVLDLVRRHAPSTLSASLDLRPWIDSIARSVVTGSLHSEAFPITPAAKANEIGRQYPGPVVVITDALAYSATDMFVAGFRDHDIGPILGVDDNTGAGGANVWSYSLLHALLADKDPKLDELPGGCDCRVSMRRTLRVGTSAGMPLEDLGVIPDARHYMTKRDVLAENEDLIAHAVELLRS